MSHFAGVADAYNALGRLATVRGNLAEAWEYHEQGQALCKDQSYHQGLAWSLNAVGELERARRNYPAAITCFQQSLALFRGTMNPGAAMLVSENLAFSLWAVDKVSIAETYFEDVLQFWIRGDAAHGIALCLTGLAGVAYRRNSYRQAAKFIAFAKQQLQNIGAELELGDRFDYERILSALQEKLSASEFFDIEREVHQLSLPELFEWPSVAPTASSVIDSGALTQREREVLKLVAAGLTDKEIAAQCVVSPHTVNSHLRSIYRKLGVNTRAAAVSVAHKKIPLI
jgi:DNA-binding CsgD family transcriptional regulator